MNFYLGDRGFFKSLGFTSPGFLYEGIGNLRGFFIPGFFRDGNFFSWDEISHQKATSDFILSSFTSNHNFDAEFVHECPKLRSNYWSNDRNPKMIVVIFIPSLKWKTSPTEA